MDIVILLMLFIVSPLTLSLFGDPEPPLKPIVMFAPLLILEPFLVTYLGCTIGQYIFGIQVVRVRDNSKCSIYLSFPRYYRKLILGSVSLMYMLFSKKHQAIHDHLAQTLVVLSPKRLERSPKFAAHGETEQELDEGPYVHPSTLRRFLAFIVWSIMLALAIGVIVEGTLQFSLTGYSSGDDLPKALDVTLDFLYRILFFAFAVIAVKRYLPGARRRRRAPEPPPLPKEPEDE